MNSEGAMDTSPITAQPVPPKTTYWLTRFIILRWMGFVYLVAFYVAAEQLVPLVGSDGLTPAPLYFKEIAEQSGGTVGGFFTLPSLFWIDCSNTSLNLVSWVGVALSLAVLAGYANAVMMAVLWFLYMSIVNVGQEWYGFGWEIQMQETGFLTIFLCPLLDGHPFSTRPPPLPVIFLFRWLIFRIMLGSALIKLRGDSCWHDLTALYYHFETQPIPNPLSRWFHFLPHSILQAGVIWTFIVELGTPWFVFWPRWGRYVAGVLIVSFQFNLIISGNLSFFNWLTILPALACFDDRFWMYFLPARLKEIPSRAILQVKPSLPMTVVSWVVTVILALLSIRPALNLVDPNQAMNTSYDPLHLVNTYGAFGTVGRERSVIILEGTNQDDPNSEVGWKAYAYLASPCDPKASPRFIAPYQPHLDWQIWFAAMGTVQEYPWTLNLVWKLLHNDPETLSLFADNPFSKHPPHYIRAVLYTYHFAAPGNSAGLYWNREKRGLWLPPLSMDSPELINALQGEGWLK